MTRQNWGGKHLLGVGNFSSALIIQCNNYNKSRSRVADDPWPLLSWDIHVGQTDPNFVFSMCRQKAITHDWKSHSTDRTSWIRNYLETLWHQTTTGPETRVCSADDLSPVPGRSTVRDTVTSDPETRDMAYFMTLEEALLEPQRHQILKPGTWLVSWPWGGGALSEPQRHQTLKPGTWLVSWPWEKLC
jgi:hypothetical protein